MNSAGGFAKLWRSVFGHPAFRDAAEESMFMWMIAKAAWQPSRVRYKDRIIHLKRGQLALSARDMAQGFQRSRSWIQRFLDRLKIETMIETDNGPGVTIITICNYSIYQDNEKVSGPPVGPPNGPRPGHDRATEQEEEEVKKDSPLNPPKGKMTFLPSDWKPPPVSDLSPKAQESARQWSADAYARTAEAFALYWHSRRRAMVDWNKTWAGWILREHWRVMQEARRGQPAGEKTFTQLYSEGRG